MKLRPLGQSELEVSPIALGCWAMARDGIGGPADDNESISTIQEAIARGINLIDVSPVQRDGHCESLVGKAIQGRRHEVLVAGKCGLVRDGASGEYRRSLEKDSVIAQCEASLRRLRIEQFDLYCCQWPDPRTPIAQTLEAMNLLLQRGSIRAVGLADFGTQRMSDARAGGTVHACQTPFSMLNSQAADELIPYCQEYRLGVMATAPLHKGLLTGQFRDDSRFEEWQRRDPEFLGQRLKANLAKIESLAQIAQNYEKSVGQLALHWAAMHAGVTCAIVGMCKPSQVRECVGAMGWEISPDDHDRIQTILQD